MAVELPDRVGGRISLDLVNTVDPRHEVERREYLPDYAALLAWSEQLGDLLPCSPGVLRRLAATDPAGAEAAWERALTLREALYRVLAAAEGRQAVRPDDLAMVNEILRDATDHHVLVRATGGTVRDGWVEARVLDSMLWPVVIDAWDLLTTPAIGRVRECPGDDGRCGWLFLDTSRSGTRRWCDMRTCGNRDKARNHYARTH